MNEKKKITVLGSGSWGATLAYILATGNPDASVFVWGRSESKLTEIASMGVFKHPKDLKVLESMTLTHELELACKNSDLVLCAVPSEAVAELIEKVKEKNIKISLLLNATKGFDATSLKTISELWKFNFPEIKTVSLSGPNLSDEVSKFKPMKTVLASSDLRLATGIANEYFANLSNFFKIEKIDDQKGLEICAAVKNIIAIAAGTWDGFNFGTSGKGCLITKAVLEMKDIVTWLGGKPETVDTVGGLGDLLITCSSALSRNYRTGLMLAEGLSLQEIKERLEGQVSEGVHAAEIVHEIHKKNKENKSHPSPICETVYELIHSDLSVKNVKESFQKRFINLLG